MLRESYYVAYSVKRVSSVYNQIFAIQKQILMLEVGVDV